MGNNFVSSFSSHTLGQCPTSCCTDHWCFAMEIEQRIIISWYNGMIDYCKWMLSYNVDEQCGLLTQTIYMKRYPSRLCASERWRNYFPQRYTKSVSNYNLFLLFWPQVWSLVLFKNLCKISLLLLWLALLTKVLQEWLKFDYVCTICFNKTSGQIWRQKKSNVL